MSRPMFPDQKSIDAFDEHIDDVMQMLTLGFISEKEMVDMLIDEGYAPLMARRAMELTKPIEQRTITNAY